MFNISRGKSGLSKIDSHIARNAGDFGSITFKFDEAKGYHTLETVKTSSEIIAEKEAEREAKRKEKEAELTIKYQNAFREALGDNSYTKATTASILVDSKVCSKETAYIWIKKFLESEFLIEEDGQIKVKKLV